MTPKCAPPPHLPPLCALQRFRAQLAFGEDGGLYGTANPSGKKSLEVSGFQEEGSQTMPKTCIKTLL